MAVLYEHGNLHDDQVLSLSVIFNRSLLAACWFSLFVSILYYAITANVLKTFLIASFIPFRYFFFDINPSKLRKRPPSLSRDIVVSIFISYKVRRFPIPQGGFLATVVGTFLAIMRAYINGIGLMLFDSFTFLFQIKNDKKGIPLDQDINILNDNERLQAILNEAKVQNDDIEKKKLEKMHQDWIDIGNQRRLSAWDFPIQRYIDHSNYYFINKEIGTDFFAKEDIKNIAKASNKKAPKNKAKK